MLPEMRSGDRVRYVEGGEVRDAGIIETVKPDSPRPYLVKWDDVQYGTDWFDSTELSVEAP